MFTDEIECKRLLREMKLHRYLEHDNIVAIMEILQPTDPETFDDVYIVQELMDTDLHRIINSTQPLSNDHIRFFVYQLLRGMKYIHRSV